VIFLLAARYSLGDWHRFITFESQVDQAPIFVREWEPPCGIRPHATVQITHGVAEHSGRYDRLARFLAAHGCVAYALDLRGHGQTAGPDKLGQAASSPGMT
jgi:alpha-beta hydrolase superfamily lysophospholipase